MNDPPQPEIGRPLDERQLHRIEATHRGFVYQHSYAAACILAVRGSDAVVIVENHEDIEVVWPDRHVYVQVKFRAEGLSRAAIGEILKAFDAIRTERKSSARPGTAVFVVVTNTATRLTETEVSTLPEDVHLNYPGHHDVPGMPSAQADLQSAVAALTAEAEQIPLAAISATSLALKLVGYANLLATGLDEHRIAGTKVFQLCELIIEQLQVFPQPPHPYRPQSNELEIEDEHSVRIIVGFSGSGKTAWVSQKAALTTLPAAYFDVTGIPDANLPASIARELASRFIEDPAQRSTVVVNQAGVDLLRSIARRVLNARVAAPILVIDNAHLVEPTLLVTVARALEPIHTILLMQPTSHVATLETGLSVGSERLAGWDDHTIATEFHEQGARADVQTIARLRSLTAGLPLLVSAAAQLAARSFDGDPSAMCDAIEAGTIVEQTRQDTLIGTFVQTLSADEFDALALLGMSEVPLTGTEALELVLCQLPSDAKAVAAIRNLSAIHVMQSASNGLYKMHEAFRPFALEKLALLGDETKMKARVVLRDIIRRSLPNSRNLERLRYWMTLTAQTGDIDTLIDVALDEMVHQIGGPDIVRATLDRALESGVLDASSEFDLLDALAFWDSQREDGEKTEAFVVRMEALVDEIIMEPRQHASLASKQMFLAGAAGDRAALEIAFEAGMNAVDGIKDAVRVLKHNRAQSLVRMGFTEEGGAAASELADEYLKELGLTQASLLGRQPAQLAENIRDHHLRDVELRHAADAMHVFALTLRGRERTMKLIQAAKLYTLADALMSALRVSQDAVDAFLEYGDAIGARQMMEQHVLPSLKQSGLLEKHVDVVAQYSVILAYTGDIADARQLMESLDIYEIDESLRKQLVGQRQIIENVARKLPANDGQPRATSTSNLGRNDRCSCGSGSKYKRCCGA